eukprot:7372323-Pyramimonas_sp.AAC.1
MSTPRMQVKHLVSPTKFSGGPPSGGSPVRCALHQRGARNANSQSHVETQDANNSIVCFQPNFPVIHPLVGHVFGARCAGAAQGVRIHPLMLRPSTQVTQLAVQTSSRVTHPWWVTCTVRAAAGERKEYEPTHP